MSILRRKQGVRARLMAKLPGTRPSGRVAGAMKALRARL